MFFKKNQISTIEDLVAGCKKKDANCQRIVYKQFHKKMYSVCLRYTSDRHAAEDILQDGFLKVFTQIHTFESRGSFEGWMRRIFAFTAIDFFRKQRNLYPIVDVGEVDFAVVESDVIQQMNADSILEVIGELSHGYRTVFNLFAIEGFSHAEIAEKMGISVGTSKSQLARARHLIIKKLETLEMQEQQEQSDYQYARTQ